MKMTNEGIDNIADMVKLSLREEEKLKLNKDLNQLIDFIESMNEMNTDDIEPMAYIHSSKNIYRQDIESDKSTKEELHANAPGSTINGYYVVPHILK